LSTGVWFSYTVLWVLFVVVSALVILLYRQFGLTYMAGSRRISLQGIDVGSAAPDLSLTSTSGENARVQWNGHSRRPALVVFAAPACRVCEPLAEEVLSLPSEWSTVDFIWVDRSNPDRSARPIDDAEGWTVGTALEDAAHREWDVAAVPFAFAVSTDGEVVQKALVNRRDDLERLVAAIAEKPDISRATRRS
jgi:methylamine dehydrogenase accessory protein MauD